MSQASSSCSYKGKSNVMRIYISIRIISTIIFLSFPQCSFTEENSCFMWIPREEVNVKSPQAYLPIIQYLFHYSNIEPLFIFINEIYCSIACWAIQEIHEISLTVTSLKIFQRYKVIKEYKNCNFWPKNSPFCTK